MEENKENTVPKCWEIWSTPAVEYSEDGNRVDLHYRCPTRGKNMKVYYLKDNITPFEEYGATLYASMFPVCLECVQKNLACHSAGNSSQGA